MVQKKLLVNFSYEIYKYKIIMVKHMSDDKKRVLIVDDSADDIQFVMENLKQEFAVLVATSGKKGLELAAKNPQPDVILMDVMMPEMDGYETCRKLKENDKTKNIDVIFVSAHDTTEEKLAGYDAGGSDYLIKPVQHEELLQKVSLAIDLKEAREETSNEKDMAFQTAMTAMTSAGEQGVVLEFLRSSYAITDIVELAYLIVDSVAKYDLKCSVQLRTFDNTIHYGTRAPLPPLEEELLKRLKDEGRIIEQGKRAIFNFGGVSVLIKNMPEDEDKRGRLRDHLAILFEGADAKLESLVLHQQLNDLVRKSKDTLKIIEVEQIAHKTQSQSIMDAMLQKLEASFLNWGLNEDQETVLIQVVQDGVDESLEHFESGLSIDEKMSEIFSHLERIS